VGIVRKVINARSNAAVMAARNTCFLLNEGMALDVAYTGPEWPRPEGVEMQP
jgi:hypothetical protein